jgi:hypothetical protein|uniref:Uncharacterized protein n=1 Tax=Arabidopsis thaliana TaxID=3702 RepID=Q8LCY1_ARATH|nr:unknown [Arabidopsis thaliana]
MDNNSERKGKRIDKDNIRVKRKTLQALLNDCQRALELLNLAEVSSEDDEDDKSTGEGSGSQESRGEVSSSDREDPEADEVSICISLKRNCEENLLQALKFGTFCLSNKCALNFGECVYINIL